MFLAIVLPIIRSIRLYNAPDDGENYCQKRVKLIWIYQYALLLHLFDSLLYRQNYISRPRLGFPLVYDRLPKHNEVILISNFRRVLNVVCFLLGDSPTSEFYIPTFRNILFHLHRQIGVKNEVGWGHVPSLVHSTRTYMPMKMEQSVSKRGHIKFRRRGSTQQRAYNNEVKCAHNLVSFEVG